MELQLVLEIFGGIILFALFVLVLALIFGAPLYIPFIIRALRLRRLATKHNLKYSLGIKFRFFAGIDENRYMNSIEGNISGKNISIKDEFDQRGFRVPLRGRYGQQFQFGKRGTFVTIDGNRSRIKGGIFGYAPVANIKKTLIDIATGNEPNNLTDKKSKKFTFLVFLWILILVFILLMTLFIS